MPDRPLNTRPEVLALNDDLDIFAISRLWDQLLRFCREATGDPVLELSGVADLDLCGMQALLVLDQDCQARGVRLVLAGLRDEHRERMQDLGFPNFGAEGEASHG